MAIQHQRPDDEKLRELILYIANLSQQDRSFSAAKLNNLLFHADFLAYQKFGSSITGQEYLAHPEGPAPKRLKAISESMRRECDLNFERRKSGHLSEFG